MFGSKANELEMLDANALNALQDLENNKPASIKSARRSERLRIKVPVVARPGDSGRRIEFSADGITADMSAGGCQILFAVPVYVGHFYQLTFERGRLPFDSLIARCLRCRLIREDAYEAGMSFLDKVNLSEVSENSSMNAGPLLG